MNKAAPLRSPEFPLRVFYDGACIVCAKEIEHYRQKDRMGRLLLVDISAADFDAEAWPITQADFMAQLHAIDAGGTVFRGVDAFWAIWQAFPESTLLGLLGRLLILPVLNPLARLGYRGFARIRRYLPKRHSSCSDGSCRLHGP